MDIEEEEETDAAPHSLFPLAPSTSTVTPAAAASALPPQWLSNTSFTANISQINDAVSSLYSPRIAHPSSSEDDEPSSPSQPRAQSSSYPILESSASDTGSSDTKRAKKKKRRRKQSHDEERKKSSSSRVDSWVRAKSVLLDSKANSKDYYFDSRGDHDNLAFGSLYRMDVARYRKYVSPELSGFEVQSLYGKGRRRSTFDQDADVDDLDNKLKSGGRYWSVKYSALERHKNLTRLRVISRRNAASFSSVDDFVPLLDTGNSIQDIGGRSLPVISMIEESWDDEVLRKTREFSKMTRENPQDEKVWLDFAEFQDKVASMQPQKGARLQSLEKKISILEKAAELNPENEEILLCLLKVYQNRDSTDVLIGKWEKALMEHSDSCKLWKEFLRVVQGEFSKFKVTEMRKLYGHAIQALAAACSKQYRQIHKATGRVSEEPSVVQLEIGLIDIFISLCRFEWQTGYQELSTALFQAEIEYSMFCPSLFLTEKSKQRLFEHFWNSGCERIGEEGALGWSVWLEKEEEHRQNVIREDTLDENDGGGWTGWSEPLSKGKGASSSPEIMNLDGKEPDEELEMDDSKTEEDTEALLKMLGIDVSAQADAEVNDSSTWARWSEEESFRDYNQWMPVHAKSEFPPTDATLGGEVDEQLMRVTVFEDISEYMFSLNTTEAHLYLASQFIDFFGGEISQWICTNGSGWTGKTLSLETLPDSILEELRRINDVMTRRRDQSSFNMDLESLLGCTDDIARRTSMMKFLREATLLCLTVLPRSSILEEAALVAEDLFFTKMNSCSCSVTPCRGLAKSLLKSDRQDILLCGVYARREATFGNIDLARKVFDMALMSIEVLPRDLQSNAPLLYFWYAEMELANDPGTNAESSSRAIHILACLGSGVKYTPFKCQPSNLQLLRAHQGYKERVRTLWSAWARGVVDDSSVAVICSAALFEELTTDGTAGSEVLDQAFSMVLPERRRQSRHLELLFYYHVKMLRKHGKHWKLSEVWEKILYGLEIYPSSPKLLGDLVEISHLYTVPNKLRLIFDDFFQRKPSVIVWVVALSYEISAGGSPHRIHGLFERALANEQLRSSVLLWRCYIAYEVNATGDLSAARRIFFWAIHACPWSKKLWLDGFSKLNSVLTAKEMADLQEVMREKELNLRTDIYEILLQDEAK